MSKKIMLILLLMFFVFSVVVGLTYSFYEPKIIGNQTVSTTKISNKNIEVNYQNGSDLLIDSSNTTVTKNITLKNNNGSAMDYVLYFSDVSNTLADKTKLTYSYSCTGTGCNNRSNVEAPRAHGVLAFLVSLGSGITHTYEITLTYDGTPTESFTGRIASIKPVIYGVSFTNIYEKGTRTNDAIGLDYTVNTSTIDSDFDTAEIYKEMTQETDSYGNAFINIPRFYIKKTLSTGNLWTYQVSKIQVDNLYYLPECFINQATGDILEYVWVGKYEASINGTNLESKNGRNPTVSQTIGTFRTYARNNGSSYQIMDIHVVDMINSLFFVEFAWLDAQKIMFGFTNFGFSLKACGTTDSVPTPSGSPNNNLNGFNVMKYRGIENHYGQIWKFVDGMNFRDRVAYIAKNPANYASDVFTGEYVQIGYTCASTNNYVRELGYDSNYPFANLPTVVGADSGSIYRDYYQQATGDKTPVYGGSMLNSLGYAGINFWDYFNGSGQSSNRLGARLIKKGF